MRRVSRQPSVVIKFEFNLFGSVADKQQDLEGEDDDIFEKFDLGDNLQFDDSEHFSDRVIASEALLTCLATLVSLLLVHSLPRLTRSM